MTTDLSEVLAKDNVQELNFEATSRSCGSGHILGILATSHNHMEFLMFVRVEEGRDSSGTTWLSVMEFSYSLESLGVEEFSITILAACHKHRVVVGETQCQDFTSMNLDLIDNLIMVDVVVKHLAVVGCDDDRLVLGAPNSASEQVVRRSLDFELLFWSVGCA